jgi:hypothetical protein
MGRCEAKRSSGMADEAQKDGAPVVGDEASGGAVAAESSIAGAVSGKRPYSPPKLTSLGKVSELTFVKSLTKGDGGSSHTHTG